PRAAAARAAPSASYASPSAPPRAPSRRGLRARDQTTADERREQPPALRALRPQARVRDLVDAGEEQYEPEDGERERCAREEERPPLPLEHRRVRLRPVEGDAPARLRHVAEAEELEPGVGEQSDVEDEDERRGDPADHVRHQLAEDDPRRRLAGRLRGENEVPALQRQRLTAQDPGLERPEDEREDDGHRPHATALQVPRGDDEERNRRNREEDVRQEVHDLVDEPTGVRGGDSEDRRDARGDHTRGGAEQERAAGAEHDLRG